MVLLSEFRASDCPVVCVHYYQIGEAKVYIENLFHNWYCSSNTFVMIQMGTGRAEYVPRL